MNPNTPHDLPVPIPRARSRNQSINQTNAPPLPTLPAGYQRSESRPEPGFRPVRPDHHVVQISPPSSSNQERRIHFDENASETSSSRITKIVRKRTVKRLPLFRGNLVINCPVPDRILQNVTHKDSEEFQMMRYTAVTCEPDEFVQNNYTLRTQLYGRHTELFIVLTMYNEDEVLFARSMSSVMKNIAYLCSRDRSKMWGPDGWKKVVVCVVSDGRAKINERTLQSLGIMGCYQDGVAKSEVNGKPVQAHLYEYTAQFCVDPSLNIRGENKGMVPVQILFCLKEQNKKKLNSHRWFFNAFAPVLKPNVCVLIDVGTKPTTTSIYHLWKAFDTNPNVGGSCGGIVADIGSLGVKLLNPLVGAQNFEYKMSNIMDKPLESAFGYISVLPGAFSAYRYAALTNTSPGVGPLAAYFEGEKLHEGSVNIFKANMYLAEDRILCFELVAKKNAQWILKYVKAAKGETDVPEGVPEFISQRRRWLNGSFFAQIYALVHWYKIWNTNHSIYQMFLFQIQMLYNTVNMLFTWFGLGNFYLTFFYLTQTVLNSNYDPFAPYGPVLFNVFRQLYIFAIVIIFITSIGNRPQGSKSIYIFCMVLFAIIVATMLFLAGWTMARSLILSSSKINGVAAAFTVPMFRDLCISIMTTYGLYLLISILHTDPWHMFTSFIQYTMLLPSFINILMVYAFCNTHDISWGTKGDNKAPSLGAASGGKSGQKDSVDVELPWEDQDKTTLNAIYDRWIQNINTPAKIEEKKVDRNTFLEDLYKNFRTRTVLFWAFSNAALIITMTNESIINAIGSSVLGPNPYLSVILYSVVFLTVFRSFGSIAYLIGYWGQRYGSCRC